MVFNALIIFGILLILSCNYLGYLKYFLLERYTRYTKFGNVDLDRYWGLQIDILIAIFSKLPTYSDNLDFYSQEKVKQEYDLVVLSRKIIKVLLCMCIILLIIVIQRSIFS